MVILVLFFVVVVPAEIRIMSLDLLPPEVQ